MDLNMIRLIQISLFQKNLKQSKKILVLCEFSKFSRIKNKKWIYYSFEYIQLKNQVTYEFYSHLDVFNIKPLRCFQKQVYP